MNEFKKISWPTFGRAVKLCLIAIGMSAVIGIGCYGIDALVIACTKLFF